MSSKTEGNPYAARWVGALAALTALALVVRLPGLDSGLWIDEIVSMMYSFRTPFPASLAEFGGDNNHPFYSVLAHASMVLFGESGWSVRLPAMIAGVASVPLLYAVGVRVAPAASAAEAFAAAALLALSYHHVWFSQNARGYSMLAMFVLLGTLALVHAVRTEKTSWWLVYALVSALGVYTHLTFVFTVAGQALVVLAARLGLLRGETRGVWRGPLIGYGAAAAATLLFYAPMLGGVVNFFLNTQSRLKGLSTPSWALAEGVRVLVVGFGAVGAAGIVVLVLGGAVTLAGIVSYWRRRPFAALLLSVPGVVTLIGTLAAGRTIYPRFFLAFIGCALLFWMRGLFASAEWLARRAGFSPATEKRIGAALAVLVIGVSAISVPLVWRWPKQDFVGAMRFVDSSARPGEAVATIDATSLVYPSYYGRNWSVLKNGADLARLRAGSPVHLVFTFPRYISIRDPALGETVRTECRDAPRFHGTLGGGDVIVCRLGQL